MSLDDRIAFFIEEEKKRQQNNIELIASENYASKEVMACQGSELTNKYAEGYPAHRYYGGCQYIDEIENLAIETVKQIFGCEYANVQPHSGSSANMAVYKALLQPGDKIMGMALSSGGHLTHGHNKSFSGMDYHPISYTVSEETGRIDYDEVEKLALKERPQLIIAGASAYSREIDFRTFREIADKCGAKLMVDMAHIAGLVAAGLHQSPIPYADVVTSTTHKTLRGPRGGIILTNNETYAKKINSAIFPGIQGGPLEHVIAAKAQCFCEASRPEFVEYQKQVVKNAQAMASKFLDDGVKIVTGGTDNHLLLIDIANSYNLTGKEAEAILDNINITVNKNTIPGDKLSPFVTSGIRLGTPAMTTRGLKEKEFELIEFIINKSLTAPNDENVQKECQEMVLTLTNKYPIYK